MPLDLSVASILEKNRLDSDNPFLVALDIEVVDPSTGVVSEVLYVVRNHADVTINGVVYSSAMFDINFRMASGESPQVSLGITDFTGALTARMQAYGGGVGFNVTMSIVDSGHLSAPPDIVEYFQVTAASSQDYRIQFQLGGENEVAKTFPRRRQRKDFCGWRYKDPNTCRYVGAIPDCDLSLQGPNGCAAHGNSINFGAFPGLNSNGYSYA